ncbi:acetyltransferase [Larsenimonas suaedae]|uniref:Acetyltransferase n=1 Tax=Larsenimonas suaedae TaxID=1851019 RepID=A0ABU1GVF2_9GAMM|nr:acetyltransferase [Larsenimonas suaedae]MCM2971319.1 acetyltransferase [Larsenimonas suaedae]MDR5896029.1 acetyltransferase [Larsenimonas suaedae]
MFFIKGCASLCFLTVNTLVCALPFYVLALLKLVLPIHRVRNTIIGGLNRIALVWIALNTFWIRTVLKPTLHVSGAIPNARDQWWVVIANHRSWTDILLLQYALQQSTAPPRFFIKRELIWIPVIGLAFWALEFPMLNRGKGGRKAAEKDLEATRRLCRHALERPITIYNFVEGTRFTPQKRLQQKSPFTHLLRPKAGGLSIVLSLLGSRLSGILDATLDYQHGSTRFWDFLCGRSGILRIHIDRLPLKPWMTDTHILEFERKKRFHAWVNALWHDKDRRLS